MTEQRQRCVVRYQIAIYSGEEIVYCDANDDNDVIEAKAKMLDLSILSQSVVDEILELYSNYRQSENEKYIAQIDLILRNEYSNAKSHSHFNHTRCNHKKILITCYTYCYLLY